MRLIEVIVDAGHSDTIKGIAEQYEITDCWLIQAYEEHRCIVRMLVKPEKQQIVLDAIQNVIATSENSRVIILPVEATLPRPKQEADKEKTSKIARTREELYQTIQSGAQLNSNYLLMVIFSTIVA
ncbi:MAG: TIGR00341 family protein, partial [Thiohalomonadales bacterium]